MKFLCPSCKAKYQISDERVAGRQVKIKCRRCGEIIDISHSVAPPPPGPDRTQTIEIRAEDTVGSEPPAKVPSGAEAAQPGVVGKGVARSPAGDQQKPVAFAPPRAAPSAPRVAVQPKPQAPLAQPTSKPSSRMAGQPPSPEQPSGVSSLTVPAARLPKPGAPPDPAPRATAPRAAFEARVSGEARPATDKDAPASRTPNNRAGGRVETARGSQKAGDAGGGNQQPSAGALAGAFSQAVAVSADVAVSHHAPLDEWFVGINGSPVGPLKLSELRSKAITGAVNLDSLVWREGFEEWKTLGSYPELAAVIEEGVSSLRASVAPLPVPVVAASEVKVSLGDPFSKGANDGDTGRAVTADEWMRPRDRGTFWQWWLLIVALMCALTATLTWVFFDGRESVQAKVDAPAPAPAEPKAAARVERAPATEEAGATDGAPAPAAKGTSKAPAKASSATNPAPAETAAKPAEGLKGLGGLKLGGPAVGGPGAGTPQARGAPLDAATVQSVVSKYSGSVKRACWQPALDTRDTNAPASANVSVKMTVGVSGNVQSVSSSGDPPGYRGLARCIEQRVRGWQFPPTSETTTVNVPFKFFAQ